MFRVTTHSLLGKSWTEVERAVVRHGLHVWESVGRTALIDCDEFPNILHVAAATAADLEDLIRVLGSDWSKLEPLL